MNDPARRIARWKIVLALVASGVLGACASTRQGPARDELRFVDTETAGRLRHAASVGKGVSALSSAATEVVASNLARFVPILLTLLDGDNAVGELEARLVECARQAERTVNAAHFGERAPTRAECGEEVDVDGCGKPVTRAMLLGQQKHALALQCAREVLKELWPASFSIEQRYRYYQHAGVLEMISPQEEARLIAQGCTRELWRTIKPDIVLHTEGDWLRSILTLEFKFPCPDTNQPQWTRYGATSAYAGSNQGRIYKEALGGEALIISPRSGVSP